MLINFENLISINEVFTILLMLILSIIQSIAGVGILLIGTPVLLLKGFDIISTINTLLPFSILTSLLNLIFFKFQKYKSPIIKDTYIRKIFLYYCIPGVFVGTILILLFSSFINFKIIISFVILIKIILKNKYERLFINVNKKVKTILITIIGMIHGLTNAGGSLLAIFILSFGNNKDIVSSRYNITYFYFFLALMQYFLFKIVFYNYDIFIFQNYLMLLLVIFFGCIIGNLMSSFIKKDIWFFC